MTTTLLETPDKAKLNGAAEASRSTLLDNVGVVVETFLGATTMTVAELNALASGDLVTLASALNAPVDLKVNGVVIARGELVAVGDKFGVRIIAVSP